MTIREIGYPPGNGYIGIGTAVPTAILTVAGEDSPRIHITSNSPGPNPSRTWGLLSFTNGNFYITDITGSVDRLVIAPDGNIGVVGNLEIEGSVEAHSMELCGSTSGVATLDPPPTGGVASILPSTAGPLAVALNGTSGSIGGSALAAGATATGTVTVFGAVVGRPVLVSASDGTLPNPLVVLSAAVTSTNVVTVQLSAIAAITPTAKTCNVTVIP